MLRIALIGSLTTTKPSPKDADLLVTVQVDADPVQLAAVGCKLKRHAQQQNRGADIFLCSAEEVYLGRLPQSVPSPLLFTPDGRLHTNGALLRQRYALDIGGGTTDFTGRKGLELLPGSKFFFLLSLGVWLSNAIFTVLGVTAPVGPTPLTGLLGFIFHLLLSRAELYLWHRWRDP